MSEPVSLSVHADRCAVVLPWSMGRGRGNCGNPPTTRALWRFEPPDGLTRIQLCDDHAAELADHERLTLEARVYDATVED